MGEILTIGTVARRSGLRPSALRYYEEAGLLPPPARLGGQRRYSPAIFPRLALIRRAREVGFTIAETRALLHDDDPDAPPAERWRALATAKMPDIEAQIARALAMQRVLVVGLRCSCATLDDCAGALDTATLD